MAVEQIHGVQLMVGVGVVGFFAGWFTHVAAAFFFGPREPRQRRL